MALHFPLSVKCTCIHTWTTTDIEQSFYFQLFCHEHKMQSPYGNRLYYGLYA